VKIFGQDIPVRADIYTIGGLSAHADQAGLMTWLGHFITPPDQTFVVHGESSNAAALAEVIQQRLHWQVSVPAQLTSVTF
jgi:metallo-beta-lactamase family protein